MLNSILQNLFAVRDIAHALHLKTKSFAEHVALDALYTKLVDMADEFAEVWIGTNGDSSEEPDQATVFVSNDAASFIGEVAEWAEKVKGDINPDQGHLLNIWDEFLSLVYRTKYKIDNLH